MEQIALLTLKNVISLLILMSVGYLLRRTESLPQQTAPVLSTLTTKLLLPSYVIRNLSQSCTMEKIYGNLTLFGLGILFTLLSIGTGMILAKFLGRSDFEKKTYRYAFTFPNIGYFGYPLIEGVFGTEMLGNMIIFCIPLNIAIYTYGYLLFSNEQKITLKKVLSTPPVAALIIGCTLGLTGLQIPSLFDKLLSGVGNCMSPITMLLAGFVLGSFSLRKLFTGVRGYWLSATRLLGIPLLFGIGLVLFGAKGVYLMIPLLAFALPMGLNTVVFPESHGIDASDNARMCFVSYLLATVMLPLTFSIIYNLAGY